MANVALNVPVPSVIAVSSGRIASVSLLVKMIVPL